jgi:hypothetical protein
MIGVTRSTPQYFSFSDIRKPVLLGNCPKISTITIDGKQYPIGDDDMNDKENPTKEFEMCPDCSDEELNESQRGIDSNSNEESLLILVDEIIPSTSSGLLLKPPLKKHD